MKSLQILLNDTKPHHFQNGALYFTKLLCKSNHFSIQIRSYLNLYIQEIELPYIFSNLNCNAKQRISLAQNETGALYLFSKYNLNGNI